jgi:hypothetical protein
VATGWFVVAARYGGCPGAKLTRLFHGANQEKASAVRLRLSLSPYQFAELGWAEWSENLPVVRSGESISILALLPGESFYNKKGADRVRAFISSYTSRLA